MSRVLDIPSLLLGLNRKTNDYWSLFCLDACHLDVLSFHSMFRVSTTHNDDDNNSSSSSSSNQGMMNSKKST